MDRLCTLVELANIAWGPCIWDAGRQQGKGMNFTWAAFQEHLVDTHCKFSGNVLHTQTHTPMTLIGDSPGAIAKCAQDGYIPVAELRTVLMKEG